MGYKILHEANKCGVQDTETGDVIVPIKYDMIQIKNLWRSRPVIMHLALGDEANEDFSHIPTHAFWVRLGDKQGVINPDGDFIVPLAKWDVDFVCVNATYLFVMTTKDRKYGFYTLCGRETFAPQFDGVYEFSLLGTGCVKKDEMFYIINPLTGEFLTKSSHYRPELVNEAYWECLSGELKFIQKGE